ncbi:MAG: Uma2 family endonuclease [Bacteroidota bacterium]
MTHLQVEVSEQHKALLLQVLENLRFVDFVKETTPPYAYDPEQINFSFEDIQAIVRRFPENKKWTINDLESPFIFPPDCPFKIEVLDHDIYLMNPTTTHQKLVTRIGAFITTHALQNELGEVYVAPVSVFISEGTALEPDVIFVSVSRQEIVTERGIIAAPELVIEVISPSNYPKLREKKRQQYADFGIQEYWEVFPKKKKVTIASLQETGNYQIISEATEQGMIQSEILEGFELDIEKLF